MSKFKKLVDIKNWQRSTKTIAIVIMAILAFVIVLSAALFGGHDVEFPLASALKRYGDLGKRNRLIHLV